jgi:hypothetical protein
VRAGHAAQRGAEGGGGAKDDRVLLAWARDREGTKTKKLKSSIFKECKLVIPYFIAIF